MRPVISLTTDFGNADHFVGTMKGVIAGICPEANLIDITHEVPAFDVLAGALAIWPGWRYFPAGTVHLMVVDPGVGSARRPVIARIGEHYFIAPDNGLITLVLEEAERTGSTVAFHELTNPEYALGMQSFTFHGRDVFAPAAAHLANHLASGKTDLASFGPRMENPVRLEISKTTRSADGTISGMILKADRFGNLLTNINAGDAMHLRDGKFSLQIGKQDISRLLDNYAAGDPGEPFAILGSSGLLEIAINRGSAAATLSASPNDKFTLRVEN